MVSSKSFLEPCSLLTNLAQSQESASKKQRFAGEYSKKEKKGENQPTRGQKRVMFDRKWYTSRKERTEQKNREKKKEKKKKKKKKTPRF
jgi:hypothetical protein